EWNVLVDYLGGTYIAGGKLKETDTIHWNAPNYGATNESGFTALPGGFRAHIDGSFFVNSGYYGYWWLATENDASRAWYRCLLYDYTNVDMSNYYKETGLSVRCIKDIDTLTSLAIPATCPTYEAATIYPSPGVGRFTLQLRLGNGQQNVYLEITDAGGRLVKQERLNNISGLYSQTIDLTGYPKGVYTVRIVTKQSSPVKKIVIE
ncbi:MAG: T9SS type A sorting domain-containing protein, partial [Bacteroidetes bacterium]|nr:T9SS type A sorting domain-containing protein [Bacteroidota bacterium]